MNFENNDLFSPDHTSYVRGEPSDVAELRANQMGTFPWPAQDNPMLAYLLDRASRTEGDEGPQAALIWLAVHAWFEGALAALSLNSTSAEVSMPVQRETILKLALQLGVSEQTAAVSALAEQERWREQRRSWLAGQEIAAN